MNWCVSCEFSAKRVIELMMMWKSIMAALANNTSIKTLKMSDSRGHPLSGEISDQEVPENVDIVEWDVTKENGAGIYRVRRLGSKVEFVKQN